MNVIHEAAGRPYRLMLHLGGLVALAGLQPLASGLLRLSGLYGAHWPPRVFHALEVGQLLAATALFFWLASCVIGRTTLDRVSPRRRLLERGAAVAVGALAIYTAMPAAALPRAGVAIFGIAVAWLALEVCRTHGLPLERPSAPTGHAETWSIAQYAFLACAVGGATTALLRAALGWSGVPVMEGQQLAATGITNPLDLVLTVVWAAGIEDVVMVAAVTTLLTAARCPTWQIYTTVCVLEVGVHAYFGIPAIGMVIYAAGRVWLYRRYNRLLPMVAAHVTADLLAGANQTLPLGYRIVVGVLVVAAAHLYERWAQRSATAGSPPPAPTRQQPQACPDPPPPAATQSSTSEHR
ncbi:hypothetical protein ACH4VR_36425 [Streptomyces sp. NPDC020883]|uniref:hypothetical protein n=1 Tax=Streptomyces sp. NPDC020883 TaxID=3365099 RepID=UPI0037AB9E7F